MSPAERAVRFAALHEGGCFALPNAWDAGSARILAHAGAVAIATTSAGIAWQLGRRDYAVSLAESLENARVLIAATTLPVSADLEDGFGPAPEDCAATIRAAADAGLAGCTIEDTTRNPAAPIHDFDHAVARIRAAVQAARGLGRPFVLTARAENFLNGRPDLDDTVRRLVAFAEAGADCLYAPALPDMEAIRKVVAAVAPKPVNVLIAPRSGPVPLATLAEAGVRRVSAGGLLARAAYAHTLDLARAMLAGDLARLNAGPAGTEVSAAMRGQGD
ncbi:isocitrate lyase/phosphoenolpyruvate mutase family protein [Roseomonas sp. JC162]|uniref:Isocitrate lyase/phosphoenolpyruvate mutase family protein n=1 Tax=Neoroseomonas marina TaxID=1232220 RepID=A0A848EKN6_9PROT|nr:isocitrate lyase/phosphoenolpyruvate mutase family protein [Neoroseomonas marina]NMJ44462.1 isocitrate lyase/phosphoenolpyruvate mutase family protein [Neoroseomonas marina]